MLGSLRHAGFVGHEVFEDWGSGFFCGSFTSFPAAPHEGSRATHNIRAFLTRQPFGFNPNMCSGCNF